MDDAQLHSTADPLRDPPTLAPQSDRHRENWIQELLWRGWILSRRDCLSDLLQDRTEIQDPVIQDSEIQDVDTRDPEIQDPGNAESEWRRRVVWVEGQSKGELDLAMLREGRTDERCFASGPGLEERRGRAMAGASWRRCRASGRCLLDSPGRGGASLDGIWQNTGSTEVGGRHAALHCQTR